MIKVYVSYAWDSESSLALVDKLEKSFRGKNIILMRDKNHIGYKGDIRNFMNELSKGKHIIVVISNYYLRSDDCMYELLMIYDGGDFEDRIYPIILGDAKIRDSNDKNEYVKFWKNEAKIFESSLSEIPIKKKFYSRIKSEIDNIIFKLNNINALTLDEHIKSDFKHIIKSIYKKEDNIDLPVTDDEIDKFALRRISEIEPYESLHYWLESNSENLVETVINEFLLNKEKYFHTELNSNESIEVFRKSLIEDLRSITEAVFRGTSKVLIKKYDNRIDVLLEARNAYSDFFDLMIYKIESKREVLDLKEEEINLLLEYIGFLVEKHS